MIKDAHEIECMRLACRATLLVYRAVAQSLQVRHDNRPTCTRSSPPPISAWASKAKPASTSTSSRRVPHGSAKPQTLREGSILMLDDGCDVEGYTSDITRTFVLGKPTDKMKSVFDLVHRAQTAALTDRSSRHSRRRSRRGRAQGHCRWRLRAGLHLLHPSRRPRHRHGHARVALLREEQHVRLGPSSATQAGMTFSDEPGIYIRGQFGIRLEDDLLITQSGAELLTPQSPSLEDPFGNVQ